MSRNRKPHGDGRTAYRRQVESLAAAIGRLVRDCGRARNHKAGERCQLCPWTGEDDDQ